GTIAGPAIEGGLSALGRLGKAAYKNVGPVKAISDTAKYAAAGERIAGEEGGRITTEKALKTAEELVHEIKNVQEAKNKAYRAAEEASDFKIKVDDLKKRIQEAEDKGADPAQLRNLKSLVKRLTGEEEVVSQQSDELINFLDDVYSPTKITDVIEEGAEKTLGASDLNLLKQEGRKIKSRVY